MTAMCYPHPEIRFCFMRFGLDACSARTLVAAMGLIGKKAGTHTVALLDWHYSLRRQASSLRRLHAFVL